MTKIKNRKTLFISLISLVILVFAYIILMLNGPRSQNLGVDNEELKTTWYYYNDQGVATPLEMNHKYDVDANEEFVVFTTVSNEENRFDTLYMHSLQQRITIYIDDVFFYDNSSVNSFFSGKAEQEKINLVYLPDEIEGKTIKIVVTCPYNRFSGYIEDVKIGYRQAFTMDIFAKNFPYLCWCLFLLIVALVLLLSTVLFVKSNDDIKRMSGLLGAVAFLSFGIICESELLTLYIDGYINGVTYSSVIMFVFLFIYYMRNSITKTKYRKVLLVLQILTGIHLVLTPILHILKIFDLFQSLGITIIFLIVTMFVFAAYKINQVVDLKKNNPLGWRPIFEAILGSITFLLFVVCVSLSYTKLYYYVVPCSLLVIYIFYRYGISIKAVIDNARKTVEYESQLKETKNYLIQSQMKAHFIFNTLGAIRTMIVSQPNTAYNMMTDFTKYLRANISNISPNEQIPFSQELDHIKAYVNIEKQRFQRRLEVIYDIKCTNFFIPPLSVEPLVENAVKHGVCKRVEGGIVKISTYENEEKFFITVFDDGVGFDINILEDESKKNSVGLRYIKIRLETLAHADFTIQSIPNKGTIATISINKNK